MVFQVLISIFHLVLVVHRGNTGRGPGETKPGEGGGRGGRAGARESAVLAPGGTES